MMVRVYLLITILALTSLTAASCGGGGGICAAYIDRLIECEIIPPENAAAVRDQNISVCKAWDKNYKEPVMEALFACIDVPCEEYQTCAAAANQLCVSDVSAEIDLLCEKVVECGWEDLTTMELCREELQMVSMTYMCLKPEKLADYVACVRSVTCGPESEDEWYVCGFEHVQS